MVSRGLATVAGKHYLSRPQAVCMTLLTGSDVQEATTPQMPHESPATQRGRRWPERQTPSGKSEWPLCTWPAGHPSGLLEVTRTDLSGCSDTFADEPAVLRGTRAGIASGASAGSWSTRPTTSGVTARDTRKGSPVRHQQGIHRADARDLGGKWRKPCLFLQINFFSF